MALPASLSKMVGPLPIGAWIVVVGGGLGIYLYTKRQNTAATPTLDNSTGAPGADTSGTPSEFIQTSAPDSTDVAGPPQDNDAWGNLAINYLIAQGYDPAVSDSAVRKYLVSDKLSAQEYTLVTLALRHLGATPELLPPPTFAPPTVVPKPKPKPPAPKPKPKPPVHHRTPAPKPKPRPAPKPPKKPVAKPKVRYYTVQRGDNLSVIAKHFYHTQSGYMRIYLANRAGHRRADGTEGMIRNPNLIQPGWKLVIP